MGEVGRTWQRYVAIGDSFTEGVGDPGPAGDPRGWADRLAQRLALDAAAIGGQLDYANLAIRGRRLDDVVTRQLDDALAQSPDLISIVGGGNDILRPKADPDGLAARLEAAVVRARAAGADVLLATPTDPRGAPVVGLTRGRAAIYSAHIHTLGARHGAAVVDQWGLRALQDWRMWTEDRIHMTDRGHQRVAEAAYAALQAVQPEAPNWGPWAVPLPARPTPPRSERVRADLQWAQHWLAPWVGRRLRGRSSGDRIAAKRPLPAPVDNPSTESACG